MITIKSLTGISIEQIHKTFTKAFSDYVEPLELTVHQLQYMTERRGYNPDLSFGAFDKNELVGIITESDISGVVSSALGLGEKDSKRITIEPSRKRFGYLAELLEVLDSHRIPLMSIMSVPKSDKGDWYLIVRVKAKDAEVAAEDLKNNGFNVTDVT